MYLFKINNKDSRTRATERCSSFFVVDVKQVVVTPAETHPVFTCSKSKRKTPEQCVKSVQS